MEKFLTQKELPDSERPYEKCEAFGPGVLSDAELLAVIIRSGSKRERAVELAVRILSRPGQKAGLQSLFCYSQKELQKLKGIGRVKAIQLICVAELAKRMQRPSGAPVLTFVTPKQIADSYMGRLSHNKTEEVVLLCLDIKGRKILDRTMTTGTVSTSLIDAREILACALQNEAFSIVVLHNHPSGDPLPSVSDLEVTKHLFHACEIVGVLLRDHIIIGEDCYVSLREYGVFDS